MKQSSPRDAVHLNHLGHRSETTNAYANRLVRRKGSFRQLSARLDIEGQAEFPIVRMPR
jgi:hypothetical protein